MNAALLLPLRRLVDQFSVYLPLVMMGLLALGSYWLLRATPEPPQPQPERAVSHEPDYFMYGFSVRTYDGGGRLKTEVFGSEARHYPADGRLEIDRARIRSLAPDGRLTTATAQRVTTNADQTEYELRGQAQVVREPHVAPGGKASARLTFQGDHLRVLDNAQRVESDLPVVLQRDGDRIDAQTLNYDDKTGVADLKGRVRATLQPRSRS